METFIDWEGWHITLFHRGWDKHGKAEIISALRQKNINFKEKECQIHPFLVEVGLCMRGLEYKDVAERIINIGVRNALLILDALPDLHQN